MKRWSSPARPSDSHRPVRLQVGHRSEVRRANAQDLSDSWARTSGLEIVVGGPAGVPVVSVAGPVARVGAVMRNEPLSRPSNPETIPPPTPCEPKGTAANPTTWELPLCVPAPWSTPSRAGWDLLPLSKEGVAMGFSGASCIGGAVARDVSKRGLGGGYSEGSPGRGSMSPPNSPLPRLPCRSPVSTGAKACPSIGDLPGLAPC